MYLATDVFDLWTFTRERSSAAYLLLHTSQEKADKFFGGGRFWQIPGGFFTESKELIDSLAQPMEELGLEASAFYAVEHVYLIYNRRRDRMEAIPVFAAEVEGRPEPTLSWEHSEFVWTDAEGVHQRVNFRGLLDGLKWTRTYISQVPDPLPEFRLA